MVGQPTRWTEAEWAAKVAAWVEPDRERWARFQAWLPAAPPPEGCRRAACEGAIEFEGSKTTCPWDGEACPYAAERVAYEGRVLLAELGFGRRHRSPELARVPGGARPALEQYLDNLHERAREGQGLLLVGAPGTGKTAALALIGLVAKRGRLDVDYQTASALSDALHSHERGEDTAFHVIRTGLLLLDDFGAAYASEWAVSRFDRIMDERYSRGLGTCVSTNASVEALRAQPQWARVVSRWQEMCEVVGFGAVDQRRGVTR